MTTSTVNCPLCNTTVDSLGQAGCRACPLAAGCKLTCCPNCGYSWIEPEQTSSGRFLGRWIRSRGRRRRQIRPGQAAMTLAEVPAGWKARLFDWEATPPRRRQQLRAYGLAERSWIHVLQHTPTTIIRVDLTELALERELATTIVVDSARPIGSTPDSSTADA
jgi:Fe2+ transport system protein FeoA